MNSIFSAFIPSLHSSHHRCQSTEPLYSASSCSQPQDVRPFCSCLCIIHGGRRRGRSRGSRDFSDPATFVLFLAFLAPPPSLSPLSLSLSLSLCLPLPPLSLSLSLSRSLSLAPSQSPLNFYVTAAPSVDLSLARSLVIREIIHQVNSRQHGSSGPRFNRKKNCFVFA